MARIASCLRWRKAFSVRVACQIHLAAISGRSFELPLVVALLRAFPSRLPPTTRRPRSPLGTRPSSPRERSKGTAQACGALRSKVEGLCANMARGAAT